uniref:Peroxisomal membrane protein PEX14 n=1 Tax=Meloidogyne javanica TaxID=6303 RepID=A0A915MWL9_MELJA
MNNNSTTLKEVNNAGTSNNPPKIRDDLVNAAKQFINNPRVRNTPIEEQKAFLIKKGLTEVEINEAMRGRSGEQVLEWAKAIIIIGSTSFIFYRFVRSWVFPKLLGIPNPEDERLQRVEQQIESITETNKAIVESVRQTIGTICEQNEQINRTLLIIQSQTRNNNENKVSSTDSNRLISEIGIIKSLLLSQNQFPPIPEHSLIAPKTTLPRENGLVNNTRKLKENGGNLENNEDEQEDEEYQDLDKSSGSQV